METKWKTWPCDQMWKSNKHFFLMCTHFNLNDNVVLKSLHDGMSTQLFHSMWWKHSRFPLSVLFQSRGKCKWTAVTSWSRSHRLSSGLSDPSAATEVTAVVAASHQDPEETAPTALAWTNLFVMIIYNMDLLICAKVGPWTSRCGEGRKEEEAFVRDDKETRRRPGWNEEETRKCVKKKSGNVSVLWNQAVMEEV